MELSRLDNASASIKSKRRKKEQEVIPPVKCWRGSIGRAADLCCISIRSTLSIRGWGSSPWYSAKSAGWRFKSSRQLHICPKPVVTAQE